MFCKNCGASLPDNVQFCPNCGQYVGVPAPEATPKPQPQQPQQTPPPQPQSQPQPQYQQPQYQYQQPQYQQPYYAPAEPQVAAQTLPDTKPILVLGILSLVFCGTGLIGLILGCVAKNKAKKFVNAGGTLSGAAKVGSILATVGIIISILMMVYWFVMICYWIVLLIMGGAAALGNAFSSGFIDDLLDEFTRIVPVHFR